MPNVTTPLQSLIPQLDSALFTVYLDKYAKFYSSVITGSITFGALDQANCDTDDMIYAPITRQAYWQFAVDSVSIGKYSNNRATQAISDTGSSYM
jgi:DNA-binding beta-propeller fold protein YncE